MLGSFCLILMAVSKASTSSWTDFFIVPNTYTAFGESLLEYEDVQNVSCLINCAVHPVCNYASYDGNNKRCRLHRGNESLIEVPGWTHYSRHSKGIGIQNGDNCGFPGFHESCIEPGDVSEFDSPAAQYPKCITRVNAGAPCHETPCTDLNNAACFNGSCFCKHGYELDYNRHICVEYCKQFSSTEFDEHSGYIKQLNIGGLYGTTTSQPCIDYCNANHPDYMSIDLSTTELRCSCNYISWRQANNTGHSEARPSYVNLDRKCEILP